MVSALLLLLTLWALLSAAAVAQARKELAAERESSREARWRVQNAEERLERLRRKGILTDETRLPLSEKRADQLPYPAPVTDPARVTEGARLLAALWDLREQLDQGATPGQLQHRIDQVLGPREPAQGGPHEPN